MENSEVSEISQELHDEILRMRTASTYQVKEVKIAKKVMIELIQAKHATFLILRDDEVRKWWEQLVNTAKKNIALRNEKKRLYHLKQGIWDKLTEEDRKILKLKKPIPPKEPTPI